MEELLYSLKCLVEIRQVGKTMLISKLVNDSVRF